MSTRESRLLSRKTFNKGLTQLSKSFVAAGIYFKGCQKVAELGVKLTQDSEIKDTIFNGVNTLLITVEDKYFNEVVEIMQLADDYNQAINSDDSDDNVRILRPEPTMSC